MTEVDARLASRAQISSVASGRDSTVADRVTIGRASTLPRAQIVDWRVSIPKFSRWWLTCAFRTKYYVLALWLLIVLLGSIFGFTYLYETSSYNPTVPGEVEEANKIMERLYPREALWNSVFVILKLENPRIYVEQESIKNIAIALNESLIAYEPKGIFERMDSIYDYPDPKESSIAATFIGASGYSMLLRIILHSDVPNGAPSGVSNPGPPPTQLIDFQRYVRYRARELCKNPILVDPVALFSAGDDDPIVTDNAERIDSLHGGQQLQEASEVLPHHHPTTRRLGHPPRSHTHTHIRARVHVQQSPHISDYAVIPGQPAAHPPSSLFPQQDESFDSFASLRSAFPGPTTAHTEQRSGNSSMADPPEELIYVRVTPLVTSSGLLHGDTQQQLNLEAVRVFSVVLPLALVVQVTYLNNVRTGALTVITIPTALVSTFFFMSLCSPRVPIPTFAPPIVSAIVFSSSFLYIIVFSWRLEKEIRRGASSRFVLDALLMTLASVGQPLLVSGLLSCIAYLTLLLFPASFLKSTALTSIASVTITLLVHVTVFPALVLAFPFYFARRSRFPWPCRVNLPALCTCLPCCNEKRKCCYSGDIHTGPGRVGRRKKRRLQGSDLANFKSSPEESPLHQPGILMSSPSGYSEAFSDPYLHAAPRSPNGGEAFPRVPSNVSRGLPASASASASASFAKGPVSGVSSNAAAKHPSSAADVGSHPTGAVPHSNVRHRLADHPAHVGIIFDLEATGAYSASVSHNSLASHGDDHHDGHHHQGGALGASAEGDDKLYGTSIGGRERCSSSDTVWSRNPDQHTLAGDGGSDGGSDEDNAGKCSSSNNGAGRGGDGALSTPLPVGPGAVDSPSRVGDLPPTIGSTYSSLSGDSVLSLPPGEGVDSLNMIRLGYDRGASSSHARAQESAQVRFRDYPLLGGGPTIKVVEYKDEAGNCYGYDAFGQLLMRDVDGNVYVYETEKVADVDFSKPGAAQDEKTAYLDSQYGRNHGSDFGNDDAGCEDLEEEGELGEYEYEDEDGALPVSKWLGGCLVCLWSRKRCLLVGKGYTLCFEDIYQSCMLNCRRQCERCSPSNDNADADDVAIMRRGGLPSDGDFSINFGYSSGFGGLDGAASLDAYHAMPYTEGTDGVHRDSIGKNSLSQRSRRISEMSQMRKREPSASLGRSSIGKSPGSFGSAGSADTAVTTTAAGGGAGGAVAAASSRLNEFSRSPLDASLAPSGLSFGKSPSDDNAAQSESRSIADAPKISSVACDLSGPQLGALDENLHSSRFDRPSITGANEIMIGPDAEINHASLGGTAYAPPRLSVASSACVACIRRFCRCYFCGCCHPSEEDLHDDIGRQLAFHEEGGDGLDEFAAGGSDNVTHDDAKDDKNVFVTGLDLTSILVKEYDCADDDVPLLAPAPHLLAGPHDPVHCLNYHRYLMADRQEEDAHEAECSQALDKYAGTSEEDPEFNTESIGAVGMGGSLRFATMGPEEEDFLAYAHVDMTGVKQRLTSAQVLNARHKQKTSWWHKIARRLTGTGVAFPFIIIFIMLTAPVALQFRLLEFTTDTWLLTSRYIDARSELRAASPFFPTSTLFPNLILQEGFSLTTNPQLYFEYCYDLVDGLFKANLVNLFDVDCICLTHGYYISYQQSVDFRSNHTRAYSSALGYWYRHLLSEIIRDDVVLMRLRPPIDTLGAPASDWIDAAQRVLDNMPPVFRNLSRHTHLAGGLTVGADAAKHLSAGYGAQIVIIIMSVFVLALVFAKSLFAPVKILLTSTISLFWVAGLSEIIFQERVASLFVPYLDHMNIVYWIVPAIALPTLVGHSFQFEFLLHMNILEFRRMGYSNRASLLKSMYSMGGVIGVTAFIMSAFFGGLMGCTQGLVNQLGFVVFFAILLDSFVITLLLVRLYRVSVVCVCVHVCVRLFALFLGHRTVRLAVT